jgi:electron transfer flavoprotein beta subunit
MAKVIACFKWVVDEADIKINADLSIDLSKAKSKISEYDKNAIESAVMSAKEIGGQAAVMTFGGEKTKQSLKDALSRGAEEAYWINSDQAAADGYVTAETLAAAVRKIEDVSLVICAEGASDTYARQVGPRIGAVLDWPVITSVISISLNGNTLIAKRQMDDYLETVKVELPAVIVVLPQINTPPLPSLKAVLAASKKPVTEFQAQDLAIQEIKAKSQVIEQKAYIMARKNVILGEGEPLSRVKELVANLKKEGVL